MKARTALVLSHNLRGPIHKERNGTLLAASTVDGLDEFNQAMNYVQNPHHLCFTRKEELRAGDWVVISGEGVLKISSIHPQGKEYSVSTGRAFPLWMGEKVVASTDPAIDCPRIPTEYVEHYAEAPQYCKTVSYEVKAEGGLVIGYSIPDAQDAQAIALRLFPDTTATYSVAAKDVARLQREAYVKGYLRDSLPQE